MRLRQLFVAIWLALKSARYEWRTCTCFVVALASVLGPLLVLSGLKFGVIDSMTRALVEDPRNREIVLLGSGHFSASWFDTLNRRNDVGFAIPQTRQIAASIELRVPQTLVGGSVEMIPTAAGDPLFGPADTMPSGYSAIVLSEPLARRLNVAIGTQIEGAITRVKDQQRERVTLPLNVIGIAPASASNREIAFVSLLLLMAAEDFRDGRGNQILQWPGDAPPSTPRLFSGFRLYARSIYDVGALRDFLVAQGLEVRTHSDDIDLVEKLDRNLTLIFRVVALIGLGGYLVSIGSNLWLNVDIKRRDLAIMRLLGESSGAVVLFPIIVGTIIALAGTLLSIALYFGAASQINAMFADRATYAAVCRLLPEHFVIAAAVTLSITIAVASLAGWRASKIEPSEALRDL